MEIKDAKQIETYYQALIDRDTEFEGLFFVGVKTTGVFCIASCRARKPKFQNVVFYDQYKDALDHGFRPCKICKPTENANEAPVFVEKAIELFRKNEKEKLTDYKLRQEGLSPEKIRRWFKKHYGMTFQAFQRMYRINQAFQELKGGKSVRNAAFESGYESLSGFNYTYKKIMGSTPTNQNSELSTIVMSRFTTPIGPMFVCATSKGVCLLEFVDRRMLETEFSDIQRLLKARIVTGDNEHTLQAKNELKEYFEGTRKVFSLSLDTPGSEFQKLVWSQLSEIPYAETTHYQALTESIGKPTGARAVANANGHNRVAIVIPCHRVIGKSGELRGYGGGVHRKRWLIDHEHKVSGKLIGSLF